MTFTIMNNSFKIFRYVFFLLALIAFSCNHTNKTNTLPPNPKGYDLSKPQQFNMPDDLTEISGIAFNKGDADTIFAEQDEEGKLFYFKPGDSNVQHVKFGKSGDYEDVAISNGWVIMLRSDGTLFTFSLKDIGKPEITTTQKQEDLLAPGEYEGLYADGNSVHVLCKHCSVDKTSKSTTLFNLQLSADGLLTNAGRSTIDVKKIEELTGQKKIAFHPSALSKNPATGEWYILSSVNKLLVVANTSWNIKEVYNLNNSLFHQPEGMAFDEDNNLYISNEGDKLAPGNILKFKYTK